MSVEITTENFEKVVRQSSKPVVLDAYATWCGPCKTMAPIFDEVAEELGGDYVFAKMNVDDARDVAIEFHILSIPTFLFLKEGKVVDRHTGSLSKSDLKARAEKAFK